MFGISVYSGLDHNLETNLEYIKKAKKLGINTIFTSLHIPESKNNLHNESMEIIKLATDLDMKVIADVSKSYLDEIDISKFGIYALRLDFGFSDDEIVELTNNNLFKIHLNASTIDERYLERLKIKGANLENIEACHNFYPREDTAIAYDLMMERNSVFRKLGIKIYAFIPSQNERGKRGPMYDGLPTLEMHRNLPVMVTAQHMMKSDIDEIIIGDALAADYELEVLSSLSHEILKVPIKVNKISIEEKTILEGIHTNRTDPGAFVIRSSEARLKNVAKIIPNSRHERCKYSVTIDNHLYKRYEKELQIIKKDLKDDDRVNVVGKVVEGEIITSLIKPGSKFEFVFV